MERRHTRKMTLLAVAAACAVVAAACGDGGDEGAEREAAGDLQGETVEVAAVWTGAEQQRFQMILDAFGEETGAQTKFTSTGDDIAAVLGPRVEAGDPPDVAILPQPGLVEDFFDQGALQPLDDVAGDEVEENFPASWRELFTYDGQLYGVFFKASNKSTVWYNVATFQNAGVEPPGTGMPFSRPPRPSPTSGSPRTRSVAATGGSSRIGSRTSISGPPDLTRTISWPSTRSRGPTNP